MHTAVTISLKNQESILGYEVEARGVRECVADILSWIQAGRGVRSLACINPHSYALALEDHEFSAALHSADWLVPDGVGIVLASRMLSGRIRTRVTGSDIFRAVQTGLNERKGSVFFLGATPETLAKIRERSEREFPDVRIAGSYSPPFKALFTPAESEAMVAAVNAAAPDVLWVGMSAPKQEKWIAENKARVNVRFAGAVGAVFDFYSGQVARSHPAFQELGLEWLPRLAQQPRRLWRRMVLSAPLFAWHVLRQRLRSAAQ